MCRVGWYLVPLFSGPNPVFQLSVLEKVTISSETGVFFSMLIKGDVIRVSTCQGQGGVNVPANHVG